MTDGAGRSVILAYTIEPTDPPSPPPARLVEPIDLVPPGAAPTVTLTRARRLAAIAVMLLAGAIAICGLKVNAWYGMTLGRTGRCCRPLSIVGGLVALTMPAAAQALAHNGPRLEAGVASALWSVTMVPALARRGRVRGRQHRRHHCRPRQDRRPGRGAHRHG